jgi:hypothetical protein
LKRGRWLRRGLALGSGVLGLSLASSCYRAEIDLTVFAEGAAPRAGNDAGGAEAMISDGGDVSAVGGAAVAGRAGEPGATGQAGESSCNDELEPMQEVCRRVGPPSPEQCFAMTNDVWQGCVHSACQVCTKSVRDYPYYFAWNPCCQENETCGSNIPRGCSAACPEPTERDKRPLCLKAL